MGHGTTGGSPGGHGSPDDRRARWRLARAVRRVQPLEAILADHATNVCGLPVRRIETPGPPPGVTWSIGDEPAVRLVVTPEGPDQLLVHDLSLLAPVRKALRTRHLRIDHAPSP